MSDLLPVLQPLGREGGGAIAGQTTTVLIFSVTMVMAGPGAVPG